MFARLDENKNVVKMDMEEYFEYTKQLKNGDDSHIVQKTFLSRDGTILAPDQIKFAPKNPNRKFLEPMQNLTDEQCELSTVFLRTEHCGGMWFETMLFSTSYHGRS